MSDIPVFTLDLPQYKVGIAPRDKEFGKLLDDEIKKHFLGQNILL